MESLSTQGCHICRILELTLPLHKASGSTVLGMVWFYPMGVEEIMVLCIVFLTVLWVILSPWLQYSWGKLLLLEELRPCH